MGESNGSPLQCSCLENPTDGGAWLAAVHGVAKSQTRLSVFTFTFHFHALEKEMATHSSVLVWRIPGTEEPSGLPSVGSHRVRHDWSDSAAAIASENEDFPGGSEVKNLPASAGDVGLIPGPGCFPWRRKQLPTPVFLTGKSHGQRRLAGYSPWGSRESETT